MTRDADARVVVTGLGAVTALGTDAASTWRGLVAGRPGIRRITRFDPGGFPVQVAAEVDDRAIELPASAGLASRLGLDGKMALAAAHEAFVGAGLDRIDFDPERLGASLAVGCRCDNSEVLPAVLAGTRDDGFDVARATLAMRESARPGFAMRTLAGYGEALVAECLGVRGPLLSSSTACAAGTQAIGQAASSIRRSEADMFIAGSSESLLYPIGLLSLCLLGALCSDSNDDPPRASRPFDLTRSGFVLGEGAGMVVLESLRHARRRGAPILAEISGFGCSADAWRLTDPRPDGRGAARAMRAALLDARIEAGDIDYINAHGTSTPANDLAEALAVHAVFGAHANTVPVSSFKGMFGHATVGAGAIELVGTVCALREGLLPANINLREPDPRIELNLVRGPALAADVRHAISNSFGFGGHNATIVVSRHPD